jgi:hypothetical protein
VSVLFDQVVAASGLNAAIAPFTISRLLVRAGIRPRSVTPSELHAVLPQLEDGLAVYLRGDDLERARAGLRRLAQP